MKGWGEGRGGREKSPRPVLASIFAQENVTDQNLSPIMNESSSQNMKYFNILSIYPNQTIQ